MALYVNTTKNSIQANEDKIVIIATSKNNIVSVAPIGIQGAIGNLTVESGDANKFLTNNGTSVEWTSVPSNLTLNGGYF